MGLTSIVSNLINYSAKYEVLRELVGYWLIAQKSARAGIGSTPPLNRDPFRPSLYLSTCYSRIN